MFPSRGVEYAYSTRDWPIAQHESSTCVSASLQPNALRELQHPYRFVTLTIFRAAHLQRSEERLRKRSTRVSVCVSSDRPARARHYTRHTRSYVLEMYCIVLFAPPFECIAKLRLCIY